MKNLNTIITLGAISVLTACMGAPDAATSAGLVEVPPDTEPLLAFDLGDDSLPDECDDQIPVGAEFRIATDGRVVALDTDGVAVCTDSVEKVQRELEANGRQAEASTLFASYQVSLGLGIPPGSINGADPTPQPSSQPTRDPESGTQLGSAPGDEVEEADPSPQPS